MDSDICTEDDDDVSRKRDSEHHRDSEHIRDSEQREIDEFEEEERRIMALDVQVK
jgi:hypothetical protein